jgi:hypothetical protein
MLCTPRGEKRPPRGKVHSNQGPTRWRLLIVISPPRGGRTYVIAPRPDMAFDRTYWWPLPTTILICRSRTPPSVSPPSLSLSGDWGVYSSQLTPITFTVRAFNMGGERADHWNDVRATYVTPEISSHRRRREVLRLQVSGERLAQTRVWSGTRDQGRPRPKSEPAHPARWYV